VVGSLERLAAEVYASCIVEAEDAGLQQYLV